jgi:hypothetical protein
MTQKSYELRGVPLSTGESYELRGVPLSTGDTTSLTGKDWEAKRERRGGEKSFIAPLDKGS